MLLMILIKKNNFLIFIKHFYTDRVDDSIIKC